VLREWLGHLIMYSMTITLSGLYKDYWALGGGLFQMVGAIHKIDIKPADVEALKNGMKTMPNVVAPDLPALAKKIIKMWGPESASGQRPTRSAGHH
jgi:2-haloacid dehalogenase